MKHIALALALLLSLVNAQAGPNDKEWNPPARFDHGYEGTLHLYSLPHKGLQNICDAGPSIRGCSFSFGPRECFVFIPDQPIEGVTPQAILRHEIGHCNGWPADHPE